MRMILLMLACSALTACRLGDDDSPNSWPQFGAQRFAGIEDVALEGRIVASDPGDELTFSLVSAPQHGTLTQFSSTGAFRYEPRANVNGADSFVARVTDSAQHSLDAPIQLDIAPVNDAPLPTDDVFAVSTTNSLAVLANDMDPEGDAFVLESVETPLVGRASVTADDTVELQLPAGFKGLTKFRYRVREITGLTSEGSALVFVGIDPFKIVYLGSEGIYVNDLSTTYRVSAPESSPTRIVSMTASSNGRALAYLTREAGSDTFRLMYVDLDEPGVARPVGPSMARQNAYRISADGRYVAFELVDFPNGARTSLMLFDAESTAAPRLLGQIADTRQRLAIGAYPQFNAAGSRLYYVAEAASPDLHTIYRTEVATGSTARVAPMNGGYDAFGGYWVAHNESQLVLRYRRRAVGVFLYSDAYLGDPTQPDTLLPLTPIFDDHELALPPTISRDGSYVFLTILGASPDPPGVTSPRIVPTAAPTGYQEIGSPETWTGAETQHLDPSHMRGDSRAMLFITQWNMPGTNVFEVLLDNPSNLVPVNAATQATEAVTDGRYSPDGERIFYIRRDLQSGARALEVTRRGAFGTSTSLTLPAEQVMAHELDSSGRVALIVRGGAPESPYALVNSDAPGIYLPVAGPGATTTGTVKLVGR